MTDKKVTAQDFLKALQRKNGRFERDGEFFISNVVIDQFDVLLSQARLEARREALKEMDFAWVGMSKAGPYEVYEKQIELIDKLRSEYSGK
jgi:hypothetical protein